MPLPAVKNTRAPSVWSIDGSDDESTIHFSDDESQTNDGTEIIVPEDELYKIPDECEYIARYEDLICRYTKVQLTKPPAKGVKVHNQNRVTPVSCFHTIALLCGREEEVEVRHGFHLPSKYRKGETSPRLYIVRNGMLYQHKDVNTFMCPYVCTPIPSPSKPVPITHGDSSARPAGSEVKHEKTAPTNISTNVKVE